MYIEQPAGVGFSKAEASIPFGDALAAKDNVAFIRGFLKRFPNFNSTALYLSSESYGGHYLPTLALEIVKNAPELNKVFKGFAVGNPLMYMPFRDYGELETYNSRGLVPRPLWDQFIAGGCEPKNSEPWPNPPAPLPSICDDLNGRIAQYARGMDPYALDFPVCTDAAAGRSERAQFSEALDRARLYMRNGTAPYLPGSHSLPMRANKKGLAGYFPDYEPCTDSYAIKYLNRKDVQAAIHAEAPSMGWDECSNIQYSATDMITAMMPIYRDLIALRRGSLNMLVFSGDDDAVCSTPESQIALWNSNFKVVNPWKQWKSEGQVAGFVVKFEGVTFATVHGAGHMVPTTRPHQALQMLSNYLSGSW